MDISKLENMVVESLRQKCKDKCKYFDENKARSWVRLTNTHSKDIITVRFLIGLCLREVNR